MDSTDKKAERTPSAYGAVDNAVRRVIEDMEARFKGAIEDMGSRLEAIEQKVKEEDKWLAEARDQSAAIALQMEECKRGLEASAVQVKSLFRGITAIQAGLSKLRLGKEQVVGSKSGEAASTQGVPNQKPTTSGYPAPQPDPFYFPIFNMAPKNDLPGFNESLDPAYPFPPMPVPPAIPPVLNHNGVHFQPQVPTTQFGPITQTYFPRRDPPGMGYSANPPPGFPQVTGQGIPLYQMSTYAVHGGYMMGPQGPMVPPPSYMPGPPMAHMPVPSASMHPMPMPGPHGVANALGAGMAFHSNIHHPMMQMPNGHGHGQPAFPGNPTPGVQPRVHFEPSLGIGLTQSERLTADIERAMKEGCFEPQEFMPVNKDPHKEWWVMEMDGNWGLYQRRQIDKLKHKWCVRDGWFYAKRLEAPPDV